MFGKRQMTPLDLDLPNRVTRTNEKVQVVMLSIFRAASEIGGFCSEVLMSRLRKRHARSEASTVRPTDAARWHFVLLDIVGDYSGER